MKIPGRWFLTIAGLSLLLLFVSSVSGDRGEVKVRWDIVSISASNVVLAGGSASSKASDGSQITLTGEGTFEPGDPNDVTGGGAFQTLDSSGAAIGSGTYRVTGLVRFKEAVGTLAGSGLTDGIGNPAQAHAGLLFLTIRYSDGSSGVLVASCSLVGTPASNFEGITASKDAVDYWNVAAGGFTLFHIHPEGE